MRNADVIIERTVLRLIRRRGLRAVCDYGCGGGDLLRSIDGKTGGRLRMTGIDYFSRGKRWRKEWALPSTSPAGNLVFVDRESRALQKLSDGNGAFDLVTSVCALHHFRHPVAELRRIRSLAKTGGFILIADWDFEGAMPSGVAKNLFSFLSESFHAFAGRYHRHHYTREEALDLMSSAGFRVVRSRTARFADAESRTRSTANALAMLARFGQVNARRKDPVLKEYYRRELALVRSIVTKHGIDYPSLFVIIAQKSNRNET